MRMRAPEGTTSCSVGGEEYLVADGCVDVPDDYASSLVSHGFTFLESAVVQGQAVPDGDDDASKPEADGDKPADVGQVGDEGRRRRR